jgi:hypothetical protein
MDALHFETEIEDAETILDCSWDSIIAGIRRHAASPQPPTEAASLNEWADLLEGIRQLKGED